MTNTDLLKFLNYISILHVYTRCISNMQPVNAAKQSRDVNTLSDHLKKLGGLHGLPLIHHSDRSFIAVLTRF